MKLTKSKLKQIIKEELRKIEELIDDPIVPADENYEAAQYIYAQLPPEVQEQFPVEEIAVEVVRQGDWSTDDHIKYLMQFAT